MRVPRTPRPVVVLAAALSALALLAGCGGQEQLEPAPSAGSPNCSTALAKAPERVLDGARTPLDVSGALAWGSPTVVIRCGMPEPGPTTLACLEINSIDWVVDTDTDPMTGLTYGRSPALEVRVPAELGEQALSNALVDVGPVAAALPTTGRACVG